MISKQMTPHIHKHWKVSDRISVLQITNKEHQLIYTSVLNKMIMKIKKRPQYKTIIENNATKMKLVEIKPKNIISIVNIYAPHTQRIKDDSKELDELYDDLNKVLQELSKTTVMIIGDWNAKVGIKTEEDNV